jgi:hypothetical protein
MSNDTSSNKLPKLKGRENYKVWSSLIQTCIDGYGAWEIVLGEDKEPEEPTNPTSTTAADESGSTTTDSTARKEYRSDMKEYKEELKDFKSRSAKAKTAILVNCTDSIRDALTDYLTAGAM